jgi:hypothetical protein
MMGGAYAFLLCVVPLILFATCFSMTVAEEGTSKKKDKTKKKKKSKPMTKKLEGKEETANSLEQEVDAFHDASVKQRHHCIYSFL